MVTVTDQKGRTMTIAFNLFDLKQKLQLKIGREISYTQIAQETELHRNTVEKVFKNEADRVDLTTIAKLLLFFDRYGLKIEVGDLFKVSTPEE